MTLRRRIEQSRFLVWLLGGILTSYLSFCQRTTRWDYQGMDQLKAELANGPILLIMWHGRSLMGPMHWPEKTAQLSSLHDASPIGRVGGEVQRRCGLQPMAMVGNMSNIAASRAVLRRAREGVCIGMTGDGPRGPDHELQDAPLEWARVLKRPIYAYAFSTKRHKILGSWDRMMLPLPFTRGAAVYVRLDGDFTDKFDQTSGQKISKALNDAQQAADQSAS